MARVLRGLDGEFDGRRCDGDNDVASWIDSVENEHSVEVTDQGGTQVLGDEGKGTSLPILSLRGYVYNRQRQWSCVTIEFSW